MSVGGRPLAWHPSNLMEELTTPKDKRTFTVIGAGQMGAGIAGLMAASGLRVTLADATPARAGSAKEHIVQHFGPSSQGIEERIECFDSIEEACQRAHYVTEAVTEDLGVKREVLSRISGAVSESTIVTTNTSAIPIRDLSRAVQNDTHFLGVHWMYPPELIPAVEVIPGPRTSAETVRETIALLYRLKKVPVVVADSPGFIANRLQFAMVREAHLMLSEGLASAKDIDKVVSNSFGFRLAAFGPFLLGDMAGLDVYAGAYRTLEEAYGERFAAPQTITEAASSGSLGFKTGQGLLGAYPQDKREELLALRNEAYASLLQFRRSLPDLQADNDTANSIETSKETS